MELISKLPEDIVYRIIPYTYNIQSKKLQHHPTKTESFTGNR